MIPDDRTNIVYVSDLLDTSHPALASALTAILEARRIPVRRIAGAKQIWCRDFLPIQIDLGEFVRFRYAPDYLRGYEHLLPALIWDQSQNWMGARIPQSSSTEETSSAGRIGAS